MSRNTLYITSAASPWQACGFQFIHSCISWKVQIAIIHNAELRRGVNVIKPNWQLILINPGFISIQILDSIYYFFKLFKNGIRHIYVDHPVYCDYLPQLPSEELHSGTISVDWIECHAFWDRHKAIMPSSIRKMGTWKTVWKAYFYWM